MHYNSAPVPIIETLVKPKNNNTSSHQIATRPKKYNCRKQIQIFPTYTRDKAEGNPEKIAMRGISQRKSKKEGLV